MRLDHVSYAATAHGLVDTVQRLGSALGAPFADGGRHPRFGTRNFVLALEGGAYIEVVAPLDHPSTDSAPFGRAVLRRADDGGGWMGWAVAVDDLAPVEQRLGRTSVPGNRRRPDGVELTWRQIGVQALLEDPQLPFFTCWSVPEDLHPSHDPVVGLHIDRLEIAGDRGKVVDWLGAGSHPLPEVDVEWVDGDEPGLVAVHVATPHGVVRLD